MYMTHLEAYLRGKLSDAKRALVMVLKHPATARKAIAAACLHAMAMISAFQFLFPHISTVHEAAFTAATAFITGVGTFLTSNVVVEVTDDIERAENPENPET